MQLALGVASLSRGFAASWENNEVYVTFIFFPHNLLIISIDMQETQETQENQGHQDSQGHREVQDLMEMQDVTWPEPVEQGGTVVDRLVH